MEKKTSYEIVMEDRKRIVEKIIENMEKGDLIFSKNWNSEIMMPQNPVSQVNYLGGNRIRLIAKAIENEYKDPRWLTFNQATENGWNVRKGEKGTLCEKWIFTKKEKGIDENGNEIETEVKLDKPKVNYFYVFNAEQIEKIPELEIKKHNKDTEMEIVQNFIDSSECKVIEAAQGRAYYNPGKDEIVLPMRESFNSKEDFMATTFHEMIHSTGHESRLNREIGMVSEFGSKEYAREELVAELGSVFLQSKLGVKLEGQHFDNHSAYLKSWISLLKNDPNELFRAAVKAEKATERLHERYLEYEKEKINDLVKSAENLKPHALDSFSIHFHYAETGKDTEHLNFNEEEKKYRGIKAYEFIEKVIKFDKEYSEKREIDETLGYYKSWVSINLKGYSTDKIRIDLGDKEFGGFEKVSDALEHRLKSFPNDLIEHKKEYADSYETTPEKIEKDAKEILEKIENSISHFREKEKIYLNERELNKENVVENKKAEVNKIYAYALEGMNQHGIEKGLIAVADLNEEGIAKVYKEVKELYLKGNLVKANIVGINDRGIFYHGSPHKSNFEYEASEYAKGLKETWEKDIKNKEYKSMIIETIDRNHNLGIEKLYNKYSKEKEEISLVEKIENAIREKQGMSKNELIEKLGINEKDLSEKIGDLINEKKLFYTKNKEIKYFTDKKEFIKELDEINKQIETRKNERKKELEILIKETMQKEIPKDNYNALTGNQIMVDNHSSGEKRWVAVADVRDKNISIKENEKPFLTVTLHKEEERLYLKPIEYYNLSQLNISKEVEQKFVPMKEKNIEKSKDKGIER